MVIFHGADFYDDSVTAARALDRDLLLAYEMNDVPLPRDHGFPLRALVPNIYGIKNVKWLAEIEVVDTDFIGYWEYGGWSDRAAIKTMSRIDVAPTGAAGEPVTIGGIAFAGQPRISGVEISVDGGQRWLPLGSPASTSPMSGPAGSRRGLPRRQPRFTCSSGPPTDGATFKPAPIRRRFPTAHPAGLVSMSKLYPNPSGGAG